MNVTPPLTPPRKRGGEYFFSKIIKIIPNVTEFRMWIFDMYVTPPLTPPRKRGGEYFFSKTIKIIRNVTEKLVVCWHCS